jgi:hypothetical protein
MKESGRLEQILVKYKLTSPVSFFNRRKILISKRKTLVKILKIERIDSVFLPAAVFISDLFNRLGFRLSLAGGARAFAAAAVFSLFVILSSSLAVVYNYNRISQFIIALTGIPEYRKGSIIGANEDVKILRKNIELPVIKAKDRLITKDEIITGANGTIVFQMGKKTLARLMKNGAGVVEIDLKAKSISLRQGTVQCNVQELEKDEKFSVITPNAMIVVVGTQFSVTYENEKTKVIILKGAVRTVNLMTNEAVRVDEEKTALITGDRIELRESKEAEKIILQRFGKLEYMNNIIDKSENEMNKFWEAVQELDTENKEEDIKIVTLEDIKKKYGKLEEIQLYNGKRYSGAITARGEIYSFITVDGIKKIPAKDVKYVRIIK